MNHKTWYGYEGFDGQIAGVFCYDCAPSIGENIYPINTKNLEHYKVCPKCGRTVSETLENKIHENLHN